MMPTDVVNAASPMNMMNTRVPSLAATVSAEKSPYPIVVTEMMLYQTLSHRVRGGSWAILSKI